MRTPAFWIKIFIFLILFILPCYTLIAPYSNAEASQEEFNKAVQLFNEGQKRFNVSDFRGAIQKWEAALTTFQKLGRKQAIGVVIGSLGNAYRNLGDYRKAIEYFEKALAISEEIGDKKGKGTELGNLGLVYLHLGDHRKAIEYYEKALVVAEDIGDKRGKGIRLRNIGLSYSKLGDYRKAINYYEKALVIAEELGDKQGKDIGIGNLGDAFLALDRDKEAFEIYTKQDHPIRLGRYYLKKKDFKEAVKQFERNREKYEKAKSAGLIIPIWIGLGLSHEGMKGYEKAYQWYKKAIDFLEEQRNALSPSEREHFFEGNEFGIPRIEAYEGAVRCAFMLGKYDEAFYWAENTRGRIFSELISGKQSKANHKIPRALADEEQDLLDKIRQNKKQQQTAFEKNNPELLKQLEEEYPPLKQKMDSLINRLRMEYPQYAAVKYPQPVKLNQLNLKKGERIIEFEVTEPYTIGLVIKDGRVVKGFKVEKTRAELEAMVKKFRAPFQEGADINSFSLNLAADLTALLLKPALTEIKKGERLIIIPDESLSLLPFESLLLSAPSEALKEEAVLLAQSAQKPHSDIIEKATIIRGLAKSPVTRSKGVYVAPRISTHILFDTGSAQIKNESMKQLKEIIEALTSKELQNVRITIEGHTDSIGDPKYNLKLSVRRAQAVYDYLIKNGVSPDNLTFAGKGDIEPIADNRDEKGRMLNRRVDFVRMADASASKQKKSGIKDFVYAMDEYTISYYQSASVLSLQRDLKISRTKDNAFFGLGDPVFDMGDSRSSNIRSVKIVAKSEISSKDILDAEGTKEEGYKFSRLENTEKEIKEVGKLFNNSRIMLGAEASEDKLKTEDLKNKRYVLFSTHGILGNEIPYIKQPALVLNLVGNDKEDGFLTAGEIFGMDLNADLVGLSACKTGLGVQSAGEGVVGLSRSFMYAGADSVLVSLWSVADESTYKLMVKFFEGLKNGKDKMTAIKDAKNYLRKNGYDNPYYWAPFILHGEGY